MPSSFSRFLSDEELQRVRELYLQSLEQEGLEQPNVTPPSNEVEADAEVSSDHT